MDGPSGEVRGFRRLYEFSRRVLAEDDPEGLLQRLVEATRGITGADSVILFKIVGGMPEISAVSDADPLRAEAPVVPYSSTLVKEVIEQGRPLLLQDLPDDPRLQAAHSIKALEISSSVGAPLYFRGELTGILYAARRRLGGNFVEADRDLLTVTASQAGLLIGQALSMEALKESEERHRALVEVSPSGILVVGDGRVLFTNQVSRQLWSDRNGGLERLEVEELFDGWRSKELLDALSSLERFDSIEAWLSPLAEELAPVLVEVRGRPIRFGRQGAMQLVVNEVGEKRVGIARRARADRLVAMGAMAATVGHEINNPLSYVHGNLDYALEVMEEFEKDRPGEAQEQCRDVIEGLRSALEGAKRIRNVVSSIQGFSRLGEEQTGTSDVVKPMESSLRVAGNEIGLNVEVAADLEPTNPVGLSASRLGQVFLNLLVNAAQALEEIGQEGHRPRIEVRSFQDDQNVFIEVADNGPGIDPKVMDQLFEPFVTTKSDREGTGLGLAICAEIIEGAGGRIEVESEPGEGALFRVILPALEEEVSGSPVEVVPEMREIPSGRILVVDPEPFLGRSLQLLLSPPHQVQAVSSLAIAMKLLADPGRFDAVLCDLRLRGGLGLEVFRWVEKSAPDYWPRMIAMTTSSSSQREAAYMKGLPNGCIRKPFDKEQIRGIVGNVIAKAKS